MPERLRRWLGRGQPFLTLVWPIFAILEWRRGHIGLAIAWGTLTLLQAGLTAVALRRQLGRRRSGR
jgi:hypothetical protein